MEDYCNILLTLVLVAFVLFLVYPKSNGEFEDGYFEEKNGKEEYWWQR